MDAFIREGERELQQAAIDRLRLIADITRNQADAIRFAVEVGIPKQRIHELTGRSRSAINQTLDREAQRPKPPCHYCINERFRAARRGEDVPPMRDAAGYLLYRIGDKPEIVAQRLCAEHMREDWETRLPASARKAMTPHMPNTPGRIVYSLGGLRDDSKEFRSYFGGGDFPEWEEIRKLLDPYIGEPADRGPGVERANPREAGSSPRTRTVDG
jgi:hypothetical protein